MATARKAADWIAVLCLLFALSLAAACGDAETGAPSQRTGPTAIDDQECAVCGMLVRDQSAPRSQLVHRDGSEAFTCSVGDLLVYLSAPSPHGRAREIMVEVMTVDEDPALAHTHAHGWVDADEAWFVVGVERTGIMGTPVLAYASRADAEARARLHDQAAVLDFSGLEAWWREKQR